MQKAGKRARNLRDMARRFDQNETGGSKKTSRLIRGSAPNVPCGSRANDSAHMPHCFFTTAIPRLRPALRRPA